MQHTFKEKVVIVTGGANGIGKCIASEFRACGATVYVIDKQEGDGHYVGDIAKKELLEAFATEILAKHDKVDCIINNALPLMKGIDIRGVPVCTERRCHCPVLPCQAVADTLGCGSIDSQHLLVARPHEPAAERELHGCQRRHSRTHPLPCSEPCRQGKSKLHITGVD